VPSRLITGPPGAGKTHRLVGSARAAAARGQRVVWVALPHQRAYLYRRLTDGGALLGVEVVSGQQLMYRVLAAARALRPLVVGSERLALVGEALREATGAVPAPGEARLFAQAVAEVKRHGLDPGDLDDAAGRLAIGGPADSLEAGRLAEAFRRYQDGLGQRADYDDVRMSALRLALAGRADPGCDVLVVDGASELGPLDLTFYRALGERLEVWVSLERAPPGWPADERLAARPADVRAHRFPNPVAEARWVMRSVKRDLAEGVPERELAVITPGRLARALTVLAAEYGVPLVDETPRTLADTRAGRLLLELLEVPDHPTPTRLLAVPELAPLARAALDRGVAGRDAVAALASELGVAERWRAWRDALTPHGDPRAWAAGVVDLALQHAASSAPSPGDATGERGDDLAGLRDPLLARGLEALRLGSADGLAGWWAALLRETRLPHTPRAGVAVLDAAHASGRRFRKAYLTGATAGAYSAGEREDYFFPDDVRRPWQAVLEAALTGPARRADATIALPRRYRGADAALADALLARADTLVVTYAEADQGGPLRADPRLAADPTPPPQQPAGSPLEVAGVTPYRAPDGPVEPSRVSAEGLRRSDPCTFRVWAERLVPDSRPVPWGVRLRRALTAEEALDPARLEALRERFPEAAGWLETHRSRLERLRYGVVVPAEGELPTARLDAVERAGQLMRVLRFVTAAEEADASLDPGRRWNELYAARTLLRYPSVDAVQLVAWPLLGEPSVLTPAPLTRDAGSVRLERLARDLDERWRRWRSGPPRPTPGHHCRACGVRDVCREAQPR
jgi:ATP-dependent helicase/nuclease subunit B